MRGQYRQQLAFIWGQFLIFRKSNQRLILKRPVLNSWRKMESLNVWYWLKNQNSPEPGILPEGCPPTCFWVNTIPQSPVKMIHFLGASVCVIQADARLRAAPQRLAPFSPPLLISVCHVFHLACLMGGHGSRARQFLLSVLPRVEDSPLGRGERVLSPQTLLNGAYVQNKFYSSFKIMTFWMHPPDLLRDAKLAEVRCG